MPETLSRAQLLRAIPELRNPRYAAVYSDGRRRHFDMAMNGEDCSTVPLYSHNATYQQLFSKGWHSVSAQDIRLALVGRKDTHA